MPHFGLMDESAMRKDEAALLRAKLHLRGGRRRMRQKKYAAAIATLYDAVLSGIKWYILSFKGESAVQADEGIYLRTEQELFNSLVQAGVLDGIKEFENLDGLVDQALTGKVPPFDEDQVVTQVERWLTQLGVMPFNEEALPPEDPNTY